MKSGWTRLSGLAIDFGFRVNRIPLVIFAVLSVMVVSFKSPFYPIGTLGNVADDFPEPSSAKSNHFIGILLWRLVGGSPYYSVIGLLALLAAVLVVWLCSSTGRISSMDSRSRFLLSLTWPPILTTLPWFGYGIEAFPLGIAIAVLTQRKWLVVLGVLLATLSHAELSLASFGCLLVLSLAQPFGRFRATALIGLAVSAIAWIASTVWLSAGGVESRLNYFPQLLKTSLDFAVSRDLLGLYAGWGVWWLVIFGVLGCLKRRDALITMAAAVVLPFVAMTLTLDGNRIFAGVGAATGLAALWLTFNSDRASEDPSSETAEVTRSSAWTLGVITVATLIMPFVQFHFDSPVVSNSWQYWIAQIQVLFFNSGG